jgi:hypothetical protein
MNMPSKYPASQYIIYIGGASRKHSTAKKKRNSSSHIPQKIGSDAPALTANSERKIANIDYLLQMRRGGKVASYAFYGTCAHGTKLWAATLDMIIEQIMTIHDKKK